MGEAKRTILILIVGILFLGKGYSSGDGAQSIYESAVYAYEIKDINKALLLFKQAGELGHLEAQNRLANFYLSGDIVSQDYEEAMKWFREAGNNGDVQALRTLFNYTNSRGGKEQALALAIEIANHGDYECQVLLGDSYAVGTRLAQYKQDFDKAIEWYLKAAKSKNMDIFEKIISFYQIYVKDDVEQYAWACVKAKYGDSKTKDYLYSVSSPKIVKAGYLRSLELEKLLD